MDPVKDFINHNLDMFVELPDSELLKIHGILLQILKDFIKYCNENGLIYFLGGGTALGAVRHNGFIPWDEDVDVVMPRKDFEKFKSGFYKAYPEYRVEAPNTAIVGNTAYIKIKTKNSVLLELVGDKENPGIFIDVFPLEYAPKSRFLQFVQGQYYTLVRDIIYTIFYSKNYTRNIKKRLNNCPFKTKLELKLGYFIGKFLGIIPLHSWINYLDRITRKRESDFVVIPTGLHNYKHELFPVEFYFPPKKGIFEGLEVNLPNKIENILTEFYGDYMTPPPEDKRAQHFFIDIKLPDVE